MTKPEIGFIGIGLMGAAMVERLLACGYAVQILGNVNRERIDVLLTKGASEAESAKALATTSDVVMLCMGTSDQVESRMLGDDGVIAGLRSGTVVIDFGTSLPQSTKMLGEKVAATGATMLDAPLGRTPAHALDGLLNIMCAGDKAAFDSVKPVLDDLGENVFHLGALGSGHTTKLVNNFFGMTVATAMAETFAMADKAGLDRQALYDVMASGPLHSGMMDFVKAYGVDGNPNMLAFAIKNAAKDLNYYRRMSEGLGAQSIMSKSPNEALSTAVEKGEGDRMVSEMVDFFMDQYST